LWKRPCIYQAAAAYKIQRADRRIVEDFSFIYPPLKEAEVVLAMLQDEDRLKKSGKQVWLL
jgi:hypothetical protein